jgi:hypothetical protein
MRVIIFILVSMICSKSFAGTLDCDINDSSVTYYPDHIVRSWVPRLQKHTFVGEKIRHQRKGFIGKIETNDEDRIVWTYSVKTRDRLGQETTTDFEYVFFKSNNKVAVDVKFFGYKPMTDIWGKCSLLESDVLQKKSTNTESIEGGDKINNSNRSTDNSEDNNRERDIRSRLTKLKKLLDAGLITKEEAAEKRKAILDSL